MMGRRRFHTISVSVDASEVLEELDDDDLLQELRDRKRGVSSLDLTEGLLGSDWFARLRWHLERGECHHALAMLDSEAVRGLVADEARAAQYAEAPRLH